MDLNIEWTKEKYQEFLQYLNKIKEESYKEFHSKLTTTKYEILGIRLPQLRKIASSIFKGNYSTFLSVCEEEYYECVMIKGLIIAKIKDLDEFMKYFKDYINLIDNWAINDTFCNSLKIVAKNKEYFLTIIDELIKSNREYHLRAGLILLLYYYVEKEYINLIFKYLDQIQSDLYYVNMARAWLLCESFIKYPMDTLKYLENNRLDKFTINKAISKIRDSYRISKEQKDYITKYKK